MNSYTRTLQAPSFDNSRTRTIPILIKKIRALPALFQRCLIVIIWFVCVSQVQAQPNLLLDAATLDWQLKQEKHGIKVYTAVVKGSKYRAIQSSVLIDASLHSIVALIRDSAVCSKWADMCKNSEVHQTVSNSEYYLYTHNNLPFPIKDRDILAHVKWKIDSKDSVLSMLSSATSGVKEINPKAVRLTLAVAKW